MFAVIATGGKQYRVAEGDTIKVETLPHEAGASIDFNEVLMVSNGDESEVGQPFIKGAKVVASVVGHGRHDKVRIIKFRRRKNSVRRAGHRQNYIELKIMSINSETIQAKPKPKAEKQNEAAPSKKAKSTKVKTNQSKSEE